MPSWLGISIFQYRNPVGACVLSWASVEEYLPSVSKLWLVTGGTQRGLPNYRTPVWTKLATVQTPPRCNVYMSDSQYLRPTHKAGPLKLGGGGMVWTGKQVNKLDTLEYILWLYFIKKFVTDLGGTHLGILPIVCHKEEHCHTFRKHKKEVYRVKQLLKYYKCIIITHDYHVQMQKLEIITISAWSVDEMFYWKC